MKKVLCIENKILKIQKIKFLSICNSFNVENFKKEKKGNFEKYSGAVGNYYRDFFIENIFIEKENGKIKYIFINFINEEKIPIRTIKNIKIARLIIKSSTPKNIEYTQSEIIFYFLDFTIKIFYDIKTCLSTLILQYKI
ncbi:hypothetical protein [Janthinobacterium aquaticum]|uniref:hypothetical protein n=1 Tax=Janthinobacterium sp. FT58W TaxID=2654254 RepID=UPI00126402C2|nr:hypothetical protein [Janthinobacterium sp. FT58W]KAB8042314.1 hypothetical protein GCM43_14720 [Janthinobacterium sp. FT58W]